jgi:uracil-DNA glycosylase family 4
MFVGERPGKDEDRWGRPFVGKAGKELNRYLFRNGINREDVYVTNLCKYYAVGDKDPEDWEMKRDAPTLEKEIHDCHPRIIVSVGRYATRYFLGDVDMEVVHALPVKWRDGIIVMPVYHPAAGMHSTEMQGQINYDFEQLGMLAKGKLEPRKLEDAHPEPRYVKGLEAVTGKYGVVAKTIAVDTESYRGTPWGLSWSTVPGQATVETAADGTEIGFDGRLILHNSLHDIGILRKMGIHVRSGQFTDTMILAYLLCLEPQGLKPLAKRYCGMNMHSFEEIVAPYSVDEAIRYLCDATAQDIWPPADGLKHSIFKRMNRLLKDIGEGKIAPEMVWKRWNDWPDELKEPVITVMGDMPELNIFHVPMDEAVQYAARDADATLRIYPILKKKIEDMGLEQVSEIDHAIVPMVERMQSNGMAVDIGYFNQLSREFDEGMEQIVQDIEDLTGTRINPNSPPETVMLLYGQLGITAPKLTKVKREEATDDKSLESIRFQHPAVGMVCDYRELSKLKNSFSIVLPRLVSSDGRIRCNLRITRVSSGRLAASSPNLLAIPTRTELGKKIRKGFIAPPGRKLVTLDLNQIEMRLMAHRSEDPTMIDLFLKGEDIHQATGAMMYKVPPEAVTTVQRYAAKRVGFGVITGITGKGLLWQMFLARAMDWTEKKCDDAISLYLDDVYPGVRAFMEEKRTEARRYGYVRDMWGRIRYLPGVWSDIWWIKEEALRQSHSHDIQAGAQGVIKKSMGECIWPFLECMWEQGVHIEPLLQIHDELLFEVDENIDPDILQTIENFMTDTVRLKVPIEASRAEGPTWGDLEK